MNKKLDRFFKKDFILHDVSLVNKTKCCICGGWVKIMRSFKYETMPSVTFSLNSKSQFTTGNVPTSASLYRYEYLISVLQSAPFYKTNVKFGRRWADIQFCTVTCLNHYIKNNKELILIKLLENVQ